MAEKIEKKPIKITEFLDRLKSAIIQPVIDCYSYDDRADASYRR